MRTLVLCDDSAHPGSLTRDGLLGLGDCGYRFEWLEDPDQWSTERLGEYPLVIFSKANNRSRTESAPWATEADGRALAAHVARGNSLLCSTPARRCMTTRLRCAGSWAASSRAIRRSVR